MFYFSWALKNLYRNKKRTIGMVLLIAVISMMFFLNFAFLTGGQHQMKQTLQNFMGDIALTSRSEDFNLAGVKEQLETGKDKNDIKMIVGEYSFGNANIISDNGYLSYSYVKGYSSNYFKQLNKSVDWIEGKAFFDHPGETVIERSTASDLSVSVGDNVTVRYKTPEGAINTAVFEVSGIFIGNMFIHQNSLYVSLDDARNLGMKANNYLNHLKIFLKNSDNKIALSNIVNGELKKSSKSFYLSVWRWDSSDIRFANIFKMTRIFFQVLITLISVVLAIVLFFGIQNTFFLTFSKRANEISVLTTYGMPFTKIYKLVFWETIFYFVSGLLCGFLFALFTGSMLSGISMARLSEEMVIVLGGPNLQFNFSLNDFALVVLFMFISGLVAGFHSLRKYFKLEVREMRRGI